MREPWAGSAGPSRNKLRLLSAMAQVTQRTGDVMTTTMGAAEHVGQRPNWDCRICAEPWPCAVAKGELVVEFRNFPSVLSIYMSAQMYDAANDFMAHGAGPPADLYERFLSWVRQQVQV
jgi:hypothetical protein